MQGILLVVSGLGWLLDLLLLVLDLNYWLVSGLVSLLLWTLHFLLALPGTVLFGAARLWEGAAVSVARLAEASGNLAVSWAHAVGDGLRGDALQLLWNLAGHLLLRGKEMLQRGLLSVALCGQNLQRQLGEALGIAGGLAAYIANSLVNAALMGAQNVVAAVLGLWLTAVHVVLVGKDLMVALLSHLSSTAVAGLILFWTPFQLAVDLLLSCGTGVGLILFRHLYEVLLLLFLVGASRAIFRPSPALQALQERLRRCGHLVQILIHNLLSAEVWRRAAAGGLRLVRMYRAAWDRDQNRARTRAQDAPAGAGGAGTARGRNPQPPRGQPAEPPRRAPPSPPRRAPPPPSPPRRAPPPPSPPRRAPSSPPSASTSHDPAAGDPWKLLKQQEETKKCVICQDENKTVLLLPCRHLCLCAQCTEILLQQPILQRNCPLCRKMILQTLTVYM